MTMSEVPLVLASVLVTLWSSAQVQTDTRSILRQGAEAASEVAPSRAVLLLSDIAAAQAKLGDRRQAMKTLERACEIALRNCDEQTRPTVLAEHAVKTAEIGDVDGALRIVGSIGQPDDAAYARHLIAPIQARAGDLNGALQTIESIGGKTKETLQAFALESIAEFQAESGDFDEALQTAKRIAAISVDVKDDKKLLDARQRIVFLWIAVVQARSGRIEQSLQTVEAINDDVVKSHALKDVAEVQADSGQQKSARRLLKQAASVAKAAKLDEHLAWIAADQAQAGDIRGAQQTTSAVAAGADKACALLEISAAQQKAGDQAAATRTLQEGVRMLESSDVESYGYALADIAATLAAAGNTEGSLQVVAAIKNDPAGAYAMEAIVVDQVERAKPEHALQIADMVKDGYQRAFAFREIAVALANAESPLADEAFQKAVAAARTVEIGGGTDVIALWEIGSAQAMAGKLTASRKTFRRARKTAMAYTEEEYVAELLQDIATAQAAGGDVEGTLAWASTLDTSIKKAHALLGAALGILQRREHQPKRAERSPGE